MSFILSTLVVLYIIRVPICIGALFVADKYELESLGVRSMTTAVMFAFMPFYLLYLGYVILQQKFENQ